MCALLTVGARFVFANLRERDIKAQHSAPYTMSQWAFINFFNSHKMCEAVYAHAVLNIDSG